MMPNAETEMKSLSGTVISVERDIQIEKRGGGFYPGTRVTLRSRSGQLMEQAFHSKSLEFNETLAEGIKNLSEGDVVSLNYVKNAKGFRDFISVTAGDAVVSAPSTASSSSASNRQNDYRLGAIKGNTVTNAVSLAVARKGKSAKLEDLQEAAKDILLLHGYVEALDIDAEMAPVKEEKKSSLKDLEEDF